MNDLEYILWIPAILASTVVGVAIVKDYIDGNRLVKKAEEIGRQIRGSTEKATYSINKNLHKLEQEYSK